MDIINRDTYYNSIYKAMVINSDTDQDPEGKNRYQIYIPEVHYKYESEYKEYINDSNKAQSKYFSLFPWAVSLEANLELSDEVYGSYVSNINNQFIILGRDARMEELGVGGFDGLNIGLDAILDLAMPIIIENEVGINRTKWPQGITNDQYGNVTSNDNGAWSIGLIQWHGGRAFDILFQIAKNDTNWLSNWPDQSLSIVTDLQAALKADNPSLKRGNWEIIVTNQSIITGVRKMLTSSIGKTTQIDFAKDNTRESLQKLTSEPFSLNNPALIIFLLDIMNQYGLYCNDRTDVKNCIAQAVKYENNNKSMIEQLDDYRNYWRSITKVVKNGKTTYAYDYRRTNTYNYIVQLEKEGKLSAISFVDLTMLEGLKHVPEYGEYFWPVPSSDKINCYWGENKSKLNYSFEYNGVNNFAGYSTGKAHNGVDIGPQKPGVDGDPVIAVGDGTVAYVNGGGVIGGGVAQGNCIGIQMDRNKDHYFVYMHLCKEPKYKVGDKVKAGDVVGYMGTTGNSTGTHLHIGLHLKDAWPKPSNLTTKIDPLPFFGKKAKATNQVTRTTASTKTKITADDIIAYAKTFLGNAYVWGGKEPPNFDCSGLTHYVFKHFGYEIGLNTTEQREAGVAVARSNLQKGDLVHFHSSPHVGIYIGNNQFIHSPSTGDVVKISSLNETYYNSHYYSARRILK